MVEGRSGTHEERDVGDVHPRPDAAVLAAERQRVVEVLRGVRVDRVRREVAKIDAPREVGLWRLMRLEGHPRATLHEQRLKDVLDVIGGAEHLLHPRAPSPRVHDREVARGDVADPLRLEHDRDARREVGLADDQLSPPPDLDDDALLGHGSSLR